MAVAAFLPPAIASGGLQPLCGGAPSEMPEDRLHDLVGPGQHLLRLDFDQGAGQGQKIPHRAHVQLFQHRQVLQVLMEIPVQDTLNLVPEMPMLMKRLLFFMLLETLQ